MPYVESSAVSFVHYDEVAAELHVAFASGRAYVYFGVPRSTYQRMLTASSVGAYFNANIRDHYRYRRSAALPAYNRPLHRKARRG